MKRIHSWVAWLRAHQLIAAGALVLVLGGVWYVASGKEEGPETLLVAEGEFLQQVSVSGKVVAAQAVDLGFSQGGRTARVYVSVGQRVGVGALLAEVENGDLRAAVLQRQAALETQQAKLVALESGTRPEQLAVTESQVASSESALTQARQSLVDELRDVYTTAEDAVRNKLDQIFSNPRTNPQITFFTSDSQAESSLKAGRTAAENLLIAWQQQVLSLSASDDLGGAVAQAQTNLTALSALLADANIVLNAGIASPSTPQTTIDGYITTVGTARASVSAASASLTVAVTAQKNALTVLETAKRNLTLERAGTRQADLDAQAAQVRAARADVASAQAQLQKTLITAPFSGTVTVVNAKPGKIVSSNSPEISMISSGTYQIESFVPEINISLLEVGNQASVTLDAYGETVPFMASIVSIDPAETVRDGVSTYRAILQFEGQDERIRAGMTATVVITTQERQGIISVPQGIVRREGGKAFVEVLVNGERALREVVTGSVSSLGNIEIVSGLTPGEMVVLSLP